MMNIIAKHQQIWCIFQRLATQLLQNIASLKNVRSSVFHNKETFRYVTVNDNLRNRL